MNDNEACHDSLHDPTVVDVQSPFEVRRWCQRLVCTETMLRSAVHAVGNDPDAVRRRLAAVNAIPAGRSVKSSRG